MKLPGWPDPAEGKADLEVLAHAELSSTTASRKAAGVRRPWLPVPESWGGQMTSITSMPAAAAWAGRAREPGQIGSLADKLQVPQPELPCVRRRRISQLISDGARHRVTLVCAPPGAGKTAACAAWARDSPAAGRIVWVTVGPEDGRERFWAYVCAGLRQAAAAFD